MDAEQGASEGPDVDGARVVDHQVLPVVIRATPRYGRFLWIGVVLGLVTAVVLTWISSLTEAPGGPLSTGASGVLRVFAVYAAAAVGLGLLVMGVLAMTLARVSSRHSRAARAEHDTTLVVDFEAPATDEVPRWVLDADDLAPGNGRVKRAGRSEPPQRPLA